MDHEVSRTTVTRSIQRTEWGVYLASLAERMRERPVELSVESLALGDQRIARMPLVGISTESKDPQQTAIEVTMGRAKGAGAAITHVVQNPVRVQVKEDAGVVTCLEIEEPDGTKTLLTF